jgi:DNA-binding transcriptional ArsR family regulator
LTGHDAVAPAELKVSLPLNGEQLLALYCVLLYDRHAPRCAQLEQFAKHFDALLPMKYHYPNVAELLAFTSPAKDLNFSRASRALGLTPSAVGRQIASLEAKFGVQLFIRDGRNLVLTRASSVYLSRVTGPLRDIGNASLGIDERRRTERLVDDCLRADLHDQVVDSAASGLPLQHAGSDDRL